eukprot:SAG22_NODE_1617_length_3975_cov_3.147059_2_plen_186_part_01
MIHMFRSHSRVLAVLVAMRVRACACASFTVLYSAWRRYGNFTTLREFLELLRELQLKTVGKIIVVTFQIIGGLGTILNLQFPDGLKQLMASIASIFKVDWYVQIGIGCLFQGNYVPSLIVTVGGIAFVFAVIFGVHVYKSRKIAATNFSIEPKWIDVLRDILDKAGGKPGAFHAAGLGEEIETTES